MGQVPASQFRYCCLCEGKEDNFPKKKHLDLATRDARNYLSQIPKDHSATGAKKSTRCRCLQPCTAIVDCSRCMGVMRAAAEGPPRSPPPRWPRVALARIATQVIALAPCREAWVAMSGPGACAVGAAVRFSSATSSLVRFSGWRLGCRRVGCICLSDRQESLRISVKSQQFKKPLSGRENLEPTLVRGSYQLARRLRDRAGLPDLDDRTRISRDGKTVALVATAITH